MESTSGEGNIKNKMSSSPSKWQHGEIRAAQKGSHVPPCLTHQTAQVIKSLCKSNAMTEISTTQSSNPALLIDLTSPREITGSCWNRECRLLPTREIFLSDPCHFSNNCDFIYLFIFLMFETFSSDMWNKYKEGISRKPEFFPPRVTCVVTHLPWQCSMLHRLHNFALCLGTQKKPATQQARTSGSNISLVST